MENDAALPWVCMVWEGLCSFVIVTYWSIFFLQPLTVTGVWLKVAINTAHDDVLFYCIIFHWNELRWILALKCKFAENWNFRAMLKNAKIVEVRRKKLQTYLRLVLAQLSRDFPQLVDHVCRQTLIQTVPFFSYVFTVIVFTRCLIL